MYDRLYAAQKKYRIEKKRVIKFDLINKRLDEKRLADLFDNAESKKGFMMDMFSAWEHCQKTIKFNNNKEK